MQTTGHFDHAGRHFVVDFPNLKHVFMYEKRSVTWSSVSHEFDAKVRLYLLGSGKRFINKMKIENNAFI